MISFTFFKPGLRKDGEAMANCSKAKIRNLMSVLFNHAIRYEWLEQGRNPIKLVRQSTLRKRTPTVLEPHELQNLLSQLESPFQLMVLLAVTTGLRRSELFALKWSDLDFSNLTIDIQRSIYHGKVGSCKTAASRTSIPLPLLCPQNCGRGKRRLATQFLTIGSLPARGPGKGSRSILTW
jgi:integrase